MNSVIIVGGGLIGMLSAIELNKRGLDVTLLDRQNLGQESTWAGGGIVSPLYPWRYPDPITALAHQSQQLYPDLIREMEQQTGLSAEYINSGMLVLGDYSSEQPRDWATSHQVDMLDVERSQIEELAPELSALHEQGFWFPQIHQLRNPRMAALARAYLLQSSVTVLENHAVESLLLAGDQVYGVRTAQSDYQADAVIISSGAWSDQMLPAEIQPAGIRPIKGQMLLYRGAPGLVKRITLSEDRYIIPRQDGRVLVGSTTEDCGFDKTTNAEVRAELEEYAFRTIPALADSPFEKHWAGLRPAPAKGIPRIGPHPQLGNLFLCTGHYRNGVVMAPASVQLLAQILLNEPTLLASSDYAP